MKLAVIPARGGSKRIHRKNIRDFCGKPMIAWSIEAALESGCFDRVIVSTDDDEIAQVAREWGSEVPFVRPAELADDFTGTTEVVRHAIELLEKSWTRPTFTCCIYATAPFIRPADIRSGLEILAGSTAPFCFTVTSYAFPIQRAVGINATGHVEMFDASKFATRSQDLEEAFHDAGQFYWGRTDAWTAGLPIFSSQALPIKLPRHRVQDIDTAEDWRRAELMRKVLQREAMAEEVN